jgi:nucleoside phosphorylase
LSQTLILVAPTFQERAVVYSAVRDFATTGDVEVHACGIGPAAAQALCRSLDGRIAELRGLALLGWAGGLSPELTAGVVVVGTEAVDARGERAPCRAIDLPGAQTGPMLTVATALRSPEAKASAWDGRILAVEMEAYPLAVWALENGVPFVHARVILDAADESLPDIGDAADEFAHPRWSRLVWRLVREPSMLAGLIQLTRRARAVNPVLGSVARSVVR